MVVERRRFPRLPIDSDLRLLLGPRTLPVRARMVDLSPSGMRVLAPSPAITLQMLMQVHLAAVAKRVGITALGRVVRRDERGFAFCFDATWIDDDEKLASPELWRVDDAEHLSATIAAPHWWVLWGPPITLGGRRAAAPAPP